MSNKSIIILLLLLINVSFCYGFIQYEPFADSVIVWQNNRCLKRGDFRSKLLVQDASATTASDAIIDSEALPNGKYRFIIKACFFPYKSWSIPNMSSSLLLHEQVHFNITELAVRKMRAALRGIEINNSNFDSIYEKILSLRENFLQLNKEYDEETTHGTLLEQQIEWQEKIDHALNELKEYELKDGIELYKYREFIQQKPSADSVKEWQSKKLLKWSDFKLKNPPSASFRAGSSTNIIFSSDTLPHGKYRFDIKAYFFPYESRSNKGSSLLLHEQVHFNITELVARKMRACIRGIEIDNNNIDSLVWKALSVKKELDALGKKHDKETANGRVKTRQLEWQKKIDAQLNELKEYELKDGLELYKHKKGGK